MPVVFLGLAAVLWFDPWPFRDPAAPARPTPAWAVDTTPVREPSLHPVVRIGAYTYRCRDCHAYFPSPPETVRPLTQHRDIPREHGMNRRCFNCHHPRDRDAFVDDRGAPIPYDEPQLLCAKCHGPVYRDWTHGVHGRTNGTWNPALGPMRRLRCVECHDPHAPAFAPMRPAPGPNTLRMGTPFRPGPEPGEKRSPLLIYRRGEGQSEDE